MSKQYTDELDQKNKIWADIFLNLNDQHKTFKKPNNYGPILFKLNAKRLQDYLVQNDLSIAITKIQPHNWQEIPTDQEKWQSSFSAIFQNSPSSSNPTYLNGWPDIVISGTNNEGLPLHICDLVIVDKHPLNSTFYSQVESIFQNCLSGYDMTLNIVQRECFISNCECKSATALSKDNIKYKYQTLGWESQYGKIA